MNTASHIPVHPRFPRSFPKPPMPTPMPESENNNDDPDRDFDSFELHKEDSPMLPKKKAYDWIVIAMAAIILILVLVIIWLILAHNDDPIPEKMVKGPYGSPPPEFNPRVNPYPPQNRMYQMNPNTHPSSAPPLQQSSAGYPYQAPVFSPNTPPPAPSQPSQDAPDPRKKATRDEMDNVFNTLKNKEKSFQDIAEESDDSSEVVNN